MKEQKSSMKVSPLKIVVIEKNQGEYWSKLNQGLVDAGEIYNMEFDITAPEYEDIDKQREILEVTINSKPDGIMLVASDKIAFNSIVKKAITSEIPVVTIDLDSPNSGRFLYVGMKSPHELGREAGNLMVQAAKGKGKIAVQTGSLTAQGAAGKLDGFREVVENNGFEIVEVLNDGERLSAAYINAQKCLEKHKDLKGMYGIYGYHAYLQARALTEMSTPQDLAIIGFDMLPETIKYIETGIITASIWIQEYFFGFYAAAAMFNLIKLGADRALKLFGMDNHNYEENSIILPTMVWTKENIHLFKKQFPMYL